MAIPSLIQMKWGVPKIHVGFVIDDAPKASYLSCEIYNKPILRGLLYHLGVRRETANDVTANFEIIDSSSGKLMHFRTSAHIKTQAGIEAERVSLPASVLPASFLIAFVDKEFPGVGAANTQNTYLPVGHYTAKIEILFGNTIYKIERGFSVIDRYPFAYWEIKS